MKADLIFQFADRIGVFVFALSGGIAAVRREMDIFAIVVLAFFPAIGGETIRDIILDVPVFWLEDTVSLWMAAAGGLFAFFFHRTIEAFKPLRWADAVGLSLFAVTGAAKAAELDHTITIILIMGGITATAGGVIRDVIVQRDSFLMSHDIYATAAIFGALVYAVIAMIGIDERFAFIAGFAAAFSLRAIGIVFNLALPRPRL